MTASEARGSGVKGSGVVASVVGRLTPPNRTDGVRATVTDAQVLDLLAAARVAPSADNLQTWRFVVVRSSERRASLAGGVPGLPPGALTEASVVIVVCGVRTVVRRARREQPFVLIDVPIALTHLLLRAAELGLPHAWTLDVDEAGCRRALGVPRGVRVIAAVALG